jgi:hypothetical protein
MSDVQRFIVAELSKNWRAGVEVTPGSGLIAQQFERVINHNQARGYRLHAFQLHRALVAPDELNETIIAVFEAIVDEPRPVTPGADTLNG